MRPSTPISHSPHAQFLRQYHAIGARILDSDVFHTTAYFKNAQECIRVTGRYFHCTREEQIQELGRSFIAKFRGECLPDSSRSSAASAPGSPVTVRSIAFSDCFELKDGNHRLAIAHVNGVDACLAKILMDEVYTPLQQLLLDYIWCASRRAREIYQPIDSPELGADWTRIRRCSDRFELIASFLFSTGLVGLSSTSLDVACSYGWFVKKFEEIGFDAYGVEMDWAGIEIGRLVYGLRPDKLARSEVAEFLESTTVQYDVVSCFSLLHHFVMGNGSVSAERLLQLLDSVTKSILFLDMGQEHEAWFRKSMSGWDEDRIEQWVLRNTSFKKVTRLGKDLDSVHPFSENYGRTLFAFERQ